LREVDPKPQRTILGGSKYDAYVTNYQYYDAKIVCIINSTLLTVMMWLLAVISAKNDLNWTKIDAMASLLLKKPKIG
jgi:hypothetical protein